MLFLKRLHLALLGVVELRRWVMSIEVVMLLLLLRWLERRRCLGEYIGHLILEDRMLMNGRRAELLLMRGQKGLR